MPKQDPKTKTTLLQATSGAGRRGSAYEQIKQAILAGALRPLERITEDELAKRLGLSRTPIREAFSVLAAEGLIVIIPKRGSFVAQLSLDDIMEIYQIRIPLECMAARVAAQTLTEAELAMLDHLVETELALEGKRTAQESLAQSREFHAIINGCTRNQRLLALLSELQGQVHRARAIWPWTVNLIGDTWKEHALLLAAFRARDTDGAERLTREHLENARASTLAPMMRKVV
jgi:DNA-binding GntR family transcriptional regulator